MKPLHLLTALFLAACASSPEATSPLSGNRVQLEFRLVATGVSPGKIKAQTRGGELLLLERDVLLGSPEVASAKAEGDGIDLTLNETGKKRLAEVTRIHAGRLLAILADGVVLVSPEIRDPIEDGKLWIGDLSAEEARRIAGGLGGK